MKLNQLIGRLVLPLTILSFGILTKWWYVLPVDAPDTIMAGFPFAYVADGWWTSMSLQFFLVELILDLTIYFLFWLLIVIGIRHFFKQLTVSKTWTNFFWSLSVLMLLFWGFVLAISKTQFQLRRDWDMKVLATGYKFTWTPIDRPAPSKYYLLNKQANT